MTLQLARDLGVPEVEVIRALPDDRAVELDATRWEDANMTRAATKRIGEDCAGCAQRVTV